MDFIPRIIPHETELRKFYTNVNLLTHWANLRYLNVEDVQNRILSLAFQPIVYFHQLNALAILLRLSGATFAARVSPSVAATSSNRAVLGIEDS